MGLPRTAGRKGRPTERLFAQIRESTDLCIWCGHGGARDVNHNEPLSKRPDLALTRSNLSVIHGVTSPCPTCPWRYSRRRRGMGPRVCNSELGGRSLAQALAERAAKQPPTGGSRNW